MYQLNNLDIIILFVIGISALIALSRGLVKEVLSIIGWVLGTIGNLYFARAHALCQKLHRNRMACRGSNRFVYFDTVPDCLDSVYRKNRRFHPSQQA